MFARLAEDDKDGVMAEKVLKLFWSLAHSQDVTIEIMDQVIYNSSLVLGIRVAGARVFGRSRGFLGGAGVFVRLLLLRFS